MNPPATHGMAERQDLVIATVFAILSPDPAALDRLRAAVAGEWLYDASEDWQRLSRAAYAYLRKQTERRKARLRAANLKCFDLMRVGAALPDASATHGGPWRPGGRGNHGGQPCPHPNVPGKTGRARQRQLDLGDAA